MGGEARMEQCSAWPQLAGSLVLHSQHNTLYYTVFMMCCCSCSNATPPCTMPVPLVALTPWQFCFTMTSMSHYTLPHHTPSHTPRYMYTCSLTSRRMFSAVHVCVRVCVRVHTCMYNSLRVQPRDWEGMY